jgi:uncharacterized membrane protein
MRMNKVILLIILLLSASIVNAEDYYADVTFDISSDGSVKISGLTNHPYLQNTTTQDLTTKIRENWAIDINLPETFSEFVYTIKFPEGSEVGELNLPSTYRTTTEGNRIVLIGTGDNTKFVIKANYKINTPQQPIYFTFIIVLILAIIIVIVGAIIHTQNKKKNEAQPVQNIETQTSYNKDALTDRQGQIMEYLEKNNGKATQAELQKITNLPKASLSRNLDSLEAKGIIGKERKGMTMLVFLVKKETKEESKKD